MSCCGILIRKDANKNYECWLKCGYCKKCYEDFGEEDMENPLGMWNETKSKKNSLRNNKLKASKLLWVSRW